MTLPQKGVAELKQNLRAAGIIATEIKLRGRWHCKGSHDDMRALTEFCDSQAVFQFPDASRLLLPTRSCSDETFLSDGSLHQIALRSCLVEQSKWYRALTETLSPQSEHKESLLICFCLEQWLPPSLACEINPRLARAEDIMSQSRLFGKWNETQPLPQCQPVSSENDIAIVGMASKVPGADDLGEFWKILCQGESQHIEVPASRFGFETHWRKMDTGTRWYGNFMKDVDVFDHKFFKKSPRESAAQDPQQRLMLETAYQAVEQSGYFQSQNTSRHIGCFIGTVATDYEHNAECYPANAFTATGILKSMIAGKVSHYFGWTGPSFTIDTACSSSAVAIHQACKALLGGECTAALAGGASVMTSPLWHQHLAAASFLSPTGAYKSFDAKADGYCRGEAVAAVFLKKISVAIADGDQIFGCIAGTAVYQNQNCTPIVVPNAPSLSSLFHDVTQKARIEPKHITVVEAHGTGTPISDPAEYEGIRQVFGGPIRSNSNPLFLGSVKGLVGHTESVSGAISLIKVILMMYEGIIPPQASFEALSPHIKASPFDFMEINTRQKPWDTNFRVALVNNYGASGSNGSILVTQPAQYAGPKTSTIQSLDLERPFWFCGNDDQSLIRYAMKLRHYVKSELFTGKKVSIADLAFNASRQSNRSLTRCLIFSCRSITHLEQKLTTFIEGEVGVSTSVAQSPRPVILCFGGEASMSIGLD